MLNTFISGDYMRSWEVLSQKHYQIFPIYQVPRTHLETPLSIAPNPKAWLEWVGDSNSCQSKSFEETKRQLYVHSGIRRGS